MPPFLEFTGERFVPGVWGEIAYEHWHRYIFAQRLAVGRRVVDAACGEGYGSALLSAVAAQVVGIDIDSEAVRHARASYADACPNLRFLQASAASLPLADRSVDLIVSFETIEHLPQSLQAPMIEEFARVLTADGLLVISSPNRPEYSPPGMPPNPFHIHELDREELAAVLAPRFPSQTWLSQKLWFGSTLWRESASLEGRAEAEVWQQKKDGRVGGFEPPAAKYFIVMAARNPEVPLPHVPGWSLFSDVEEKELKRLYHQASEVLRLDKMALEQKKIIETQAERLHRLEKEFQEQSGRNEALKNALKEKEALLRYQESLSGWLRWPLSRLRRCFPGSGRRDSKHE